MVGIGGGAAVGTVCGSALLAAVVPVMMVRSCCTAVRRFRGAAARVGGGLVRHAVVRVTTTVLGC